MSEIEKSYEFKNKTLGRNIKCIRKKSNLTQEAFSERIGITPQFLSCVERGLASISLNTAIKICNTTNSSSTLLFKDLINHSNMIEKYKLLSEKDKKIIDQMIQSLLEN